jgi:hypothetical protein
MASRSTSTVLEYSGSLSVGQRQSSSITGTTVKTKIPTPLVKLIKQNKKLQHNSIAYYLRQTNDLVVREIKSHQKQRVKEQTDEVKTKNANKTRISKIINQNELQFVDAHQPPQFFQTAQTTDIIDGRAQSQRDLLKRKILPNTPNHPKSASSIVRKVSTPEFAFVEEMGSIRTGILEDYEAYVTKHPELKYHLLDEDYTMTDPLLRIRQIRPHNINKLLEGADDQILQELYASFQGIASLQESHQTSEQKAAEGVQNTSSHHASSLLTVSIDLKGSHLLPSEAIFDLDDEETPDDGEEKNKAEGGNHPGKGLQIQTSHILSQTSSHLSIGTGIPHEQSVESSLYLNSPLRTSDKRKHIAEHFETITTTVTQGQVKDLPKGVTLGSSGVEMGGVESQFTPIPRKPPVHKK